MFSVLLALTLPPTQSIGEIHLTEALAAGTAHLAKRLGHASKEGKSTYFNGFELDFSTSSRGEWRHGCRQINASRDTMEECAAQQLWALSALCNAGIADVSYLDMGVVVKHLKALSQAEIPELGMKRYKQDVPGKSYELWTHLRRPDSAPTDTGISPLVAAAALEAAIVCVNATGKKGYLDETLPTMIGLTFVYNRETWDKTIYSGEMDFRKASSIYSSLVLCMLYLPAKTNAIGIVANYLNDFEEWLRQLWERHENLQSFEIMRAVSLRLRTGHVAPLKKKKRRALKHWARLQLERFAGLKTLISEAKKNLGSSFDRMDGVDATLRQNALKGLESYMEDAHGSLETQVFAELSKRIGMSGSACHPLRGLLPLASTIGDLQLASTLQTHLQRTIERFQVNTRNASDVNLGPRGLDVEDLGITVDGAFFLDDAQLQKEHRRSLAMRDTLYCVEALAEVLRDSSRQSAAQRRAFDREL